MDVTILTNNIERKYIMAEIIISHCRLGVVTRQGTINVLYPETTGNDVYISSNDTITSTTLQGMIDNFKTVVDGLIDNKLSGYSDEMESIVNNKISSLDVSSVGGSGKYISAISETDGKISATANNFPNLSTVATTGNYNDLVNQPTIPIVNNGKLVIQKNGSNVATFNANQSEATSANIIVPTKVSEITNDVGYTTNNGTVTGIRIGSTTYNPSNGIVTIPSSSATLYEHGMHFYFGYGRTGFTLDCKILSKSSDISSAVDDKGALWRKFVSLGYYKSGFNVVTEDYPRSCPATGKWDIGSNLIVGIIACGDTSDKRFTLFEYDTSEWYMEADEVDIPDEYEGIGDYYAYLARSIII